MSQVTRQEGILLSGYDGIRYKHISSVMNKQPKWFITKLNENENGVLWNVRRNIHIAVKKFIKR